MKKFLLLFLFTSIAVGQGKEIYLYGHVTSDYRNDDITSGSIWIDFVNSKSSYFTTGNVDKKGFYEIKLEGAYQIEAIPNYHDYYAEKVIVEVGKKDSIRIDFKLIPKLYIYTQKQAIADTRNGKIQLITFDTLEYEWTRKINLKKDFGFEYLLLEKPEDDDFEDNIEEYNAIVEGLLNIEKPDWQKSLGIVRDSVVNSEADQYGRKNKIDISKLRFPEIERLPKGMRERLTTFQNNYNSWFKDKLKDYTFERTIEIIKTEKGYDLFRLLPESISMEYKKMLPEVIKLITDDTEIGMTGYNGYMFCRGIGYSGPIGCVGIPFSNDDLFTVAGRANHLLKLLTYEDFGNVLPNPDKEYLRKLQNRWAYWAMQLQQ
jgi:hypothetical protein